jgi:hypothetical protein
MPRRRDILHWDQPLKICFARAAAGCDLCLNNNKNTGVENV